MIDKADNHLRRVERTFQEALKLSSEERDAYLRQQCQDDPAIKQEVMELLEVAGTRGPLDRRPPTPVDFTKLSEIAVFGVPDRIGPFEIVRRIASGGMGIVYEAQQEQPRRTVALKVMRWELNSTEAFRRFEYESTLLSRLRHPGIAQVYEAGIHESGAVRLPYFAMEYVAQAESLTEYDNNRQLSVRQRLELFARVCDAVEHGHRRGIVHRDLKPSNILVDQEGEPRVVDFGVARSTDADMALTTMQTETGQLLGTLQYMSPEQCTGEVDLIDTRSDVYSLGVVLFEILCGQPPYDVSGLSVYEGTRVVLEEHPARLSTINNRLRGDLETIVSKAMEKERDRRYGNAGELVADIQRYLAGEAILARPSSALYQLRVFARRNKAIVAAIAGVIVSLAVGLVMTGIALAKAERARVEAEQVTSVLTEAFSSVDPELARGKEVTVGEVMDRVSDQLGNELSFGEDSLAEANLRMTIGRTYRHRGDYKKAISHLEQALNIRRRVLGEHPDVVNGLAELALAQMRSKDLEYRQTFNQAVAMHKSKRFPDSVAAGLSIAHQYGQLKDEKRFDEAESKLTEAMAMLRRVQGNESREIAWVLTYFALLRSSMQDLDAAEQYQLQSLEMRKKVLGPDHPHIVYDFGNLATHARMRGDFHSAVQWALKARDLAERVLAPDHPLLGKSLGRLGECQMLAGDYEAAGQTLRQDLEIKLKALGPDQELIWVRYNMLRATAIRRKDGKEERKWATKQKEFAVRVYGPNSTGLYGSRYALSFAAYGLCLLNAGEPLLAEPELREAVRARKQLEVRRGPFYIGRFRVRAVYGRCLMQLHHFADAEKELLGTIQELRSVDSDQTPSIEDVRETFQQLISLYEAWERPTEVARWSEELQKLK